MIQVELPPRLETMIREKVDSGEYPDSASVIAEAVRLLAERDDRQKLERRRAALQIGIDQIERGEVVEWTPELHAKLWENARRRAREGDQPSPDILP